MTNDLYSITALTFEKYMLLNNWTRDYNFRNKKLMIFISPKGKRIAIPVSETYDDFYDSLKRILGTLEIYLQKESDEIIKEILTAYYDRLEFRIQSHFSEDGKLPLGYAAECIEGLKDLVLYSSCAEQKAQPICLKASNSSKDIMNRFKLAQTEVGSFIINIDTNVVKEGIEQETLEVVDVEAPDEHKVVQRIATAISQVNDIVENKSDIENVIQDAYLTGITANMCDALLRLKNEDVQIDTTIRYASALTRKPGATEQIKLYNSHFYVINEISKRYHDIKLYKDVTLHGYVAEMRKDISNNKQLSIIIVTIIDSKLKKIHMDLTEDDYRIANEAHMKDLEIEITGELDMSNSRKWILNNPCKIKIIA